MEIDKKKIDRIETRSIYLNDILQKIPSAILRWGNTVFFLFFLSLIFAIWHIKYPDVVNSEIRIIPSNPAIIVRTLKNGYVTKVFKKDKDYVKKGEWVFVLDNSCNYEEAQQLNNILKNLENNDFWKSIDTLNLISFEELGGISTSYYTFKRHVEELSHFKEMNSLLNRNKIDSERKSITSNITNVIRRQEDLAKKEKELAYNNLQRNIKLFEKGIISKLELEKIEIIYLNKSEELERLKNVRYNSYIEMSNINRENLIFGEDNSRRYFEIRNNILNSFNTLVTSFNDWKLINVLEAPTSGVINLFDTRQEDQFLFSEQEVFTVVPENKGFFSGYLKIPLVNSGKVKISQKVIIKLNDYPYNEFGVVYGKIASISNTPLNGFYHAKVELKKNLSTSTGYSLNNKYELTGTAEIVTQSRSLLERITGSIINSNN